MIDMDKKQLQKQRIRNYFIEAACGIIEKEGAQGVTVRKVADIAGYHYATIYNYFDNLGHLMWECLLRLVDRYYEYYMEHYKPDDDPVREYLTGWEVFFRYSLDNLNVFSLIFLENMEGVTPEMRSRVDRTQLGSYKRSVLQRCVQAGRIPASKAPGLDETIFSFCIGCIVLYKSGRTDIAKDSLVKKNMDSIKLIMDSCSL